ncbi:MAG TPA: SpoIVB peptidase S55 domain-containing protein [Patescibacteria group bacterium]|nr:SpoIVB peptidase S55 domain-containing protein [Patescibacteria group bacterium]
MIMPLSEVRPGMQATVRTVFEGGKIEEFGAEIIGVMDSYLGPHQDLILARLKGDRVAFTGVAGGMSGSPVYVDGRLIGALSYRMGTFLKEPIAGVTPIEYMLAVAEEGSPGGARAAGDPPGAPDGLRPIETPLMVAGAPDGTLAMYADELARLGLGRVVPGAVAASAFGVTGGLSTPGTAATTSTRSLDPLRAGDPIAARLVTGDISFAATGTVTYVDGDKVYAFGHPAFLSGAAELPMARAEIFLTLASLQASNKMPRILDTIGTFRQSRLPAMTGVIGPSPRMVPVTLTVTGGSAPRRFAYEVVDHKVFTPLLVGFLTSASLINTPWYADEMTLALAGRIAIEGHPDLMLNDLYSELPGGQPPAATLARDVQGLFGAVFQNRWEPVVVKSVHLDVATVERNAMSVVEAVYPSRTEMEAGEEVKLRVVIRPFRGSAFTRTFAWRAPEGTPPGPIAITVGGANLLGAVERNVLARQVTQSDTLDQLITVINRLRTSDKLYMKITRREAGAVVLSEILPALPPSVLSTLSGNRGSGEVTPMAETTLHEEEIPLEQLVSGGTVVPITIK